jgi:hypothetical protein
MIEEADPIVERVREETAVHRDVLVQGAEIEIQIQMLVAQESGIIGVLQPASQICHLARHLLTHWMCDIEVAVSLLFTFTQKEMVRFMQAHFIEGKWELSSTTVLPTTQLRAKKQGI